MKLATYIHNGRKSFGVVTERGVCEIPPLWPDGPRDLLGLLQLGEAAIGRLSALVAKAAVFIPLDQVRLRPPLPNPPKVLALAVDYVEHHREWDRGADLPDDPGRRTTPRPFLMPATCIIGPGDEIPWPAYSKQIDHEVELAIVIGSRCSRVRPEDALRHVAGYTIANDVSARSCTHAEGRSARPKDDFFDWLHGKWADGFCPTGPWIVTADEIGDPQNLALELAVNGDVRQRGNTGQMIHGIDKIVSFCSQLMTLTPGDLILTGTPSGVAMATGKWLAGGDAITCRIERIGELTNALGRPPAGFYAPCKA